MLSSSDSSDTSYTSDRDQTCRKSPIQSCLGFYKTLLNETGLSTLLASSLDVKLLLAQRLLRMTAYGSSALILVSYLELRTALSDDPTAKLPQSAIGLFMTATLLGDVGISFLLALYADRIGRRAILASGAVAMTLSGLTFALSTNYWVLLLAAVLGVITPSGSDVGVFRILEESVLAHLTPVRDRATIFAWYGLGRLVGQAVGIAICGWITTFLVHRPNDPWTVIECYRGVFCVYAAVGVVKLLCTLCMSEACELDDEDSQTDETIRRVPPGQEQEAEHEPLLAAQRDQPETAKKSINASQSSDAPQSLWFPQLSQGTKAIVGTYGSLLFVDFFGNGMTSMTWLSYYFTFIYHLEESSVGTLFFLTSIAAGVLAIASASLAKRIGNINTAVITGAPGNFMLILMGSFNSLPLSITAAAIKLSMSQMDTAPITAFLATAVDPSERTAVMGIISIIKTAGYSVGPALTGLLVQKHCFWVALIVAGLLNMVYETGLVLSFREAPSR